MNKSGTEQAVLTKVGDLEPSSTPAPQDMGLGMSITPFA